MGFSLNNGVVDVNAVIPACGRTKNFVYAYYTVKIFTAMITDGSVFCLAHAYSVDDFQLSNFFSRLWISTAENNVIYSLIKVYMRVCACGINLTGRLCFKEKRVSVFGVLSGVISAANLCGTLTARLLSTPHIFQVSVTYIVIGRHHWLHPFPT